MANEPEVKKLCPAITCHAWNADRTQVALCPNNNEIHIFKKGAGGVWNKLQVLREHDQVVTSVDWSHTESNRIVSCSQDRNAYVWTQSEGAWKPTLVILRINRAATAVKWSPSGEKFAVASGSKCVSVCYFEVDNDWWVSKHIKAPHTSTVLSLDWHPSNLLLATGGTDFKARIFWAGIKGVDKKGTTPFQSAAEKKFGNLMAEWDCATGWIHSVAFSPSGNKLAYAAHDSSLVFVDDVAAGFNKVQKIAIKGLPCLSTLWLTEDALVAGGHGNTPILFEETDGKWNEICEIDTQSGSGKKASGKNAAFDMFQAQAKTGQNAEEADSLLKTKHQNCIKDLSILNAGDQKAGALSSAGIDGAIVVWPKAHLVSLGTNLKTF